MERLQLWWNLAGPSSMINKIAQLLGEKERVLCVAAPDPKPLGLCKAIEHKLRAELSLECAIIDVSHYDQTQPIPHLLAGLLGVSAVEIGSVSDFASHPSLVDQVLIVDGIDCKHLRRWSLFLRQLHSERAGEAIVGPVVIVLLPIGLNRDDTAELCGSSKLCRHKVRWIATTQ